MTRLVLTLSFNFYHTCDIFLRYIKVLTLKYEVERLNLLLLVDMAHVKIGVSSN